MKSLVLAAIAIGAVAAPAIAASPFDGTWKADVKTAQLPAKPDVFVLKGGTYRCVSCVPPVTIPADGQFHAVTGHDYYDMISAKVVDPHTVVMTRKKGAKVVGTSTNTVSADGKTLSFTFEDMTAENGVPVKGSGSETRVTAAPAGAHALSGSWKMTKFDGMSDAGLTQSFAMKGKALEMTTPTGQSYLATIGGAAVPIKGDPGNTMAAVKQTGARTIVESDTRKGKLVGVYTMTVSADGKTMMTVAEDRQQGTTTRYSSMKQ